MWLKTKLLVSHNYQTPFLFSIMTTTFESTTTTIRKVMPAAPIPRCTREARYRTRMGEVRIEEETDHYFADLHGGVEKDCFCFPDVGRNLNEGIVALVEWIFYSKRERQDRARARELRAECLEQIMFDHGSVDDGVKDYCDTVIACKERVAEDQRIANGIASMECEDIDVGFVQKGYKKIVLEDHSAIDLYDLESAVIEDERDGMLRWSDEQDEQHINVEFDEQISALQEAHDLTPERVGQLRDYRNADRNRFYGVVRQPNGFIALVRVEKEPNFVQAIEWRPQSSGQDTRSMVARVAYSTKLVSILINVTRAKYGKMKKAESNLRVISHYMRQLLRKQGMPPFAIDRHVSIGANLYFNDLHYDLLLNALIDQSLANKFSGVEA